MSAGAGEQERGAVIPAKPCGAFAFRSNVGLGGGSVVGRKKNTLVCCDG